MNKMTLAVVSSALVLTACGGGSSSGNASSDACIQLNSDSFDCNAMIGELADVQKAAVTDFSTRLVALKQETTEYCAALENNNAAALRSDAQTAWNNAMLSWQTLEVMQFGPVKESRTNFYSWPLSVNKTCNMDAAIASGNFSSLTPQLKGLPAVEYALYEDAPLATCTDQPAAAAAAQNRCDFALEMIGQMETAVTSLSAQVATYNPATNPGGQAAAQEIFNALFYVYNQTKGDKLQKAVLPEGANGTFKPTNFEIPFADINANVIAANLKAAQSIMTAGDGINGGFASYLAAAGQQTLASDMLTSLNAAVLAAEGVVTPLRTVVAAADADYADDDVAQCINATADSSGSDVLDICALDKKIKVFTDDLKGQMSLNLGLIVPSNAQADGD